MSHEIEYRLVIPTTDNSGQPIRQELLEQVAHEMAKHFGGVTAYAAAGCYDDTTTGFTCDPNMVVSATEIEGQRRHTDAEDRAFVNHIAQRVGVEFGQNDVIEQELPEDVARYEHGVYQQTLGPHQVNLALPRIAGQDVFATVLPGRFSGG